MNVPHSRVRIALSQRDVATIERAVKHYQLLGLEASPGMTGQEDGRAAIWYVDPRERMASTYQLDIQKYSASFGQSFWVIEISRSTGSMMTLQRLGEVSSKILLFALTKAEQTIAATKDPHREGLLHKDEISGSALQTLDKLAVALSSPKGKSNMRSEGRSGSWGSPPGAVRLTESFAALEKALSVDLEAHR